MDQVLKPIQHIQLVKHVHQGNSQMDILLVSFVHQENILLGLVLLLVIPVIVVMKLTLTAQDVYRATQENSLLLLETVKLVHCTNSLLNRQLVNVTSVNMDLK